MILIVYVFPRLRTVKDVVRNMSKKSRLRKPFDKEHGRRSQTLLKSAPLSHLLITVKELEFEKVSLIDM